MENTLLDLPQSFSTNNVFVRMFQSISFRYQHATDGLTDAEIQFRPIEGSMNIRELLDHIYQLCFWMSKSFELPIQKNKNFSNLQDYRNNTQMLCEALVAHSKSIKEEDLESIKIHLFREKKDYPIWYIINGPIADILSHIGQLNSWRRMAGNPCKRISVFTGKPY